MGNIVKYKDYCGSVEYVEGVLVVKILHIDDTITDECESASEVEACFAEMVEDYIETCRIVGKEPSKPFRGSFNVRVSPYLHRRAAMAATIAGKSLNAWVESAMESYLGEVRSTVSLRELKLALQSGYSELMPLWYQSHQEDVRVTTK